MQHTVQAWLVANWLGVAAFAVYAALEWFLPRTKWFKANSAVEGLANLAKQTILARVPLVSLIVSKLATPTAPVADSKENK